MRVVVETLGKVEGRERALVRVYRGSEHLQGSMVAELYVTALSSDWAFDEAAEFEVEVAGWMKEPNYKWRLTVPGG